jgi:hypothetical protein
MAAIIAATTVYMFNDDLYPRFLFTFSKFYPQSTYRGRGETGGMYLPSQLERTPPPPPTSLYVIVDIVKGGGHASPTHTSLG